MTQGKFSLIIMWSLRPGNSNKGSTREEEKGKWEYAVGLHLSSGPLPLMTPCVTPALHHVNIQESCPSTSIQGAGQPNISSHCIFSMPLWGFTSSLRGQVTWREASQRGNSSWPVPLRNLAKWARIYCLLNRCAEECCLQWLRVCSCTSSAYCSSEGCKGGQQKYVLLMKSLHTIHSKRVNVCPHG